MPQLGAHSEAPSFGATPRNLLPSAGYDRPDDPRFSKLREKLGELVHPGDLIAEVHEIQTVSAEIDVSERDIGEVRVGQRGRVRLRAWPARTFDGTVTAIAPAASDPGPASAGDRVVKVAIAIGNRDGLLKPRMTGYARIDAGQRRALDLVTRRFRRFLRVEFWSWW